MLNKEKSCCFTGYRPGKFPFEFDKTNPEYIRFENKLTDAIFSLPQEGCYTFYCGMAMGFDILAGETVALLKRMYSKASITLVAVVPFSAQCAAWPEEWQERYRKLLKRSDKIITVCSEYQKYCYDKRNKFMVDNSDIVLTWFDGKPGGTASTLSYARKKGKKIVNLSEYGVHEFDLEQTIYF